MADLTSRPDSWMDYLPDNWQHSINTSPILNALGRAMNRRPADIEGASKRIFAQPGDREVDDRAWLLQQAQPQRRLNPLAAEMLDKGGLLANFIGPGAKLPPVAPKPTGIRAYHGSPHDFDKFDISKIGTGEGAQAYGRGLYFAESERVARSYRDDLGGYDFGVKVPRRVVNEIDVAYDVEQALAQANGNPMRARQILEQNKQHFSGTGSDAMFDEALKLFDEIAPTLAPKPRGRMYEVNIKADPDQFLDYDSRIQSPVVTAALGRLKEKGISSPLSFAGSSGLREREMAVNRAAAEEGIAGIKYLDQQSRVAGKGSRNYVVFDDKLIEILRKYGLLPPVAAGTAAALNQQEPQQ